MNKNFSTVVIGAVIAFTGVGAFAQNEALVIATWGGDYTAAREAANFAPYTKATEVNIQTDIYTGGLGKVRGMVETGNITWDIFQAEAEDMHRGCDEGLLEVIDWKRIPDAVNLIAEAKADCGIGSVVAPVVLAHSNSAIGDGVKSWADFWDVKTYPGKRALRRGPKYVLEAALFADGVDKKEIYKVLSTPEGLDRAFSKLDQIKEDLLWWDTGGQPREWLDSGEVVMTLAFGGRIATAIESGKAFTIDWNSSFYSISWWSIVAGSRNLDAAHDFLAFTATADAQAEFSKIWPSGPVNKEAAALLTAERKKLLPIAGNLERSTAIDEAFWAENYDRIDRRFQTWISRN